MNESNETNFEVHTTRNNRQRGGNRLWLGVIFIMVGVFFILRQFGIYTLHNWWALFILLPAIGSFTTGVELWAKRGRLDYGVRSTFMGGLFPLAVACMFLFELDWRLYWPVFILLPGISMLVNSIDFDRPGRSLYQRFFQPWLAGFGLGMLFLGGGFLAQNLGWFDPRDMLYTWWAIAILFPAAAGVIAAGVITIQDKKFSGLAVASLASGLVTAVPGVVALLGLSWNLITPIILLAAGTVLLISFFVARK